MRKETEEVIQTCVSGLTVIGETVMESLFGKQYDGGRLWKSFYQLSRYKGPFVLKMTRIADIADGDVEVPTGADLIEARVDMLYLIHVARLFRGNGVFHKSAWSILGRSHALLSDKIMPQNAMAILGEDALGLTFAVKVGWLHTIQDEDGVEWYAGYEVLDLLKGRQRLQQIEEEEKGTE